MPRAANLPAAISKIGEQLIYNLEIKHRKMPINVVFWKVALTSCPFGVGQDYQSDLLSVQKFVSCWV